MAASPGGNTTVPSYNLSQDDHTIQVRIHCPLAPPNSQPTVVADGQIFGFTCPKMGTQSYYLPLFLPMPVHSPVLVRDPATSALVVTLRKSQPGVHIPDLILLQPSIHPDIPFFPELLATGAATPVSPFGPSKDRSGYISPQVAALGAAGAGQGSSVGSISPALPSLSPMAPVSGTFPDTQPSEDPEVRQAADELIALGLKNENERRRAQGQSPLILTPGEETTLGGDRHGFPSHFSHGQESSEASTRSSALSTTQDDDLNGVGDSDVSGGADGLTAVAHVPSSPSPGKMYPYGFRAAFTGPFMPPAALSSSTPVSSASSTTSTVESASGAAPPLHVRSKVHELQQDARRVAWNKRRQLAKMREEEKWDEGRYLDGYVDEFGEVAEILAWEPEQRLEPSAAAKALAAPREGDESFTPPSPFDKTSREAHLAALQFLFAYCYDWRTTQGEHNVESEWTLSVLCRSLVAQCPIEPASPAMLRTTSPAGSLAGAGSGGLVSPPSGELGMIGGLPRAVSPVSSLSGGSFPHQPLEGALFSNAAAAAIGTPTLRGASPEASVSHGGGGAAATSPPTMPMLYGSNGASVASAGGALPSHIHQAAIGRRPGSSDAVGSPPPGAAGILGSPALSSSLSGSLSAPRRASALSVSGLGPGGLEYGSNGGGAGSQSVGGGSGAERVGGGPGGRGKLPAMRDEPALDTPLSILGASYRRALTFPLHRSWALCDKVRDDVLVLLRAGLKPTLTALAFMEDRLANAEDAVMHRYAEVWVRPVREWLENRGSDHSLALLAAEIEALSSELTRDFVGGEVWDLELLEAAARDALEEGHGGYS